jgi:hypothetical protein
MTPILLSWLMCFNFTLKKEEGSKWYFELKATPSEPGSQKVAYRSILLIRNYLTGWTLPMYVGYSYKLLIDQKMKGCLKSQHPFLCVV